MVALYSKLLQRRYKGKLDQRADEYLDYTSDGALRMEALVHDLLAYTQAVSRTEKRLPAVLRVMTLSSRRLPI